MTADYKAGTDYENLIHLSTGNYQDRVDSDMSNLFNKEHRPSVVTSRKTHSQMLDLVKKRLTKALKHFAGKSQSAPEKAIFQSLLSRVSTATSSPDLIAVVSEALETISLDDKI